MNELPDEIRSLGGLRTKLLLERRQMAPNEISVTVNADDLRFDCDPDFASMPTVITDPTRHFMTTSDVTDMLNWQADEILKLKAALELIAAVRHVSGSAQGAFRSNLRIADAALAGADMRDLATVEAVELGTWHKSGTEPQEGTKE